MNYQNDIVGKTRTRTSEIYISVPVDDIPTIRFIEEEVVLLVDGTEKKIANGRTISVKYDGEMDVELRDPSTDSLIDSDIKLRIAMLYVYSAIRQLQTNTDAQDILTKVDITPQPDVVEPIIVPDFPTPPPMTIE